MKLKTITKNWFTNMKYSSAAITGSSGFIGTHLMQELEDRNIDTHGISLTTNSIDVTKWDDVQQIPPKDLLFHLAGITNIPRSFEAPREVYLANTLGTLNMLEWCRLNNVKKIIYVSTFVYGIPQYLPIDEKHPIAPNNPYSQSKLMGEELCEAYCRDYNLDATILRLFNVYGPLQKGYFLIPHILEQLDQEKIILGDPVPKRDFLYIDDVIDALICASDCELEGCNIFNIGSGSSNSVKEISDMLANIFFEETGKNVSIGYTHNVRESEITDTIANIDKAKSILSWHSKTDIKTGLTRTLRAYLNEYQK